MRREQPSRASGAVLALDQGTSGTKALVARADGSVAACVEVPVHPRAVAGGGVEQDPEELWESLLAAGRTAVERAGVRPTAVALANQGETVLAWDRATGKPLSAAVSWQDRRAQVVCDRLAAHREEIEQASGLKLDAYFSAPKMTWLREQGCDRGVVTTTDAWLLHRLAGAYVTDAATASRTLLLDLDGVAWSPRLCALFGVRAEELPEIVDCASVVGTTDAFGAELPVAGVAVDQQAALFAQGCHVAGEAKCTYGTGAFLLVSTGAERVRSAAGLVSCVAWRLAGRTTYCLDGQVYTVGAAVDWLRGLGIVRHARDLDALAGQARPAGEVFVPAFTGLAAPYWAGAARGLIGGLGLATGGPELVRAALEGIAAAVAVLAEAVAADLRRPLTLLRADGGLTRSAALMQAQADLLQSPVAVYPTPYATALGVAALARLALGEIDSPDEAAAVGAPAATYEPACGPEEARARLARWRRAAQAAVELGELGGP